MTIAARVFSIRAFSIRTLQLVCLAVAGVAMVLQVGSAGWFAFAFFVYSVFLTFGIAMGYHRGLSHRLLASDSFAMWFCLLFGTLASLGRPVEWALIHRLHHQNSDLQSDPHSPKHQGFWIIFSNRWKLLAGSADARPKISMVRDLKSSRAVDFYQKNYYRMIGLYLVLLFLGGGWPALIFGYCWPVVLSVLATSLVNSVCHLDGEPRDHWLVALFTFGEGIHARHHLEPKSIDLSYGMYFDSSGWLMNKLWAPRGEKRE